MRIGLLAMSGVRAHDKELMEFGLTLPGFVDRSRVIASLPSLALVWLAAVTPDGHDIRYFESEDLGDDLTDLAACDLVAISTYSAQAFEAYAIADRLRDEGVRVAIGGLHVSVCADEALEHADYVVAGEGENVWPAVVAAAEQGAEPRVFDAADFPPVKVEELPVPRYDLLAGRPYNRFTVQATRGCPWRCDFCASTVMLKRPYRKRPIDHVLRDIEAIRAVRQNPFIEFADDNTFVDKKWSRELCRALIPLGIKWFTETDLSLADDEELLGLLHDAGCRQVLIGLESPDEAALHGIEQRSDFKARRFHGMADAIHRIQSHGVTVNGCFVLGLDGHSTQVFERVEQTVEALGLYEVQITVMTPFSGTPLYERLAAAGRLLEPAAWDKCTLFDVNVEPTHMTADDLRSGLRSLAKALYSDEATGRRRRFFETLRTRRG